jgi:putative two-component system hydrogenase maturation factor HypX/HoxX
VTREAVELAGPDLVIAPFLKRGIAEGVWRQVPCFIVHPGIRGDRGPSSLDWAILDAETSCGVTVLQAEAEMDAGPVWASCELPMRDAAKSSLYRDEVAEAAVVAVLEAVDRFAKGGFTPERVAPAAAGVRGRQRPTMSQADRAIDWSSDTTARVLAKIRSGDGNPGVRDRLFDRIVHLYNAKAATVWAAARFGRAWSSCHRARRSMERCGSATFGSRPANILSSCPPPTCWRARSQDCPLSRRHRPVSARSPP